MDERPHCETGIHQNPRGAVTSLKLATATSFKTCLQRQRETKAKMNFWDFIKIKGFCTAKETVNKTKRLLREWEKMFTNDTTKG